jgi:arginyl-tRNA synthetase
MIAGLPKASAEFINGDEELWALVLEASRLDEVVEQVVRTLEFAVLAKYGFGLAKMFSAFYQNPRQSVVNEEREDIRMWRVAAVLYTRRQLARVLDLMGVAVPARM